MEVVIIIISNDTSVYQGILYVGCLSDVITDTTQNPIIDSRYVFKSSAVVISQDKELLQLEACACLRIARYDTAKFAEAHYMIYMYMSIM